MDDQHNADVENAKKKLQEVQEAKEARKVSRTPDETPQLLTRQNAIAAESVERGIKPVTAKPKKKKFGQRLKEAMFSEDIGDGSVTEYVFFKIIVPSFKQLIGNALNSAVNMALGLDPRTRTINAGGGNTHTANASLYRDRNFNRSSDDSYGRRCSVSEYEWDQDTANDIYSQIMTQLEAYNEISLGLVYSIMGMPEKIRTTDRFWGWKASAAPGIRVIPLDMHGERCIINFPDMKPLDR